MGYSPKLWGSQAWHFIHYVAVNYPEAPTESDKVDYKAFIDSLSNVMPCGSCGYHFKQYVDSNPPNMDNRQSLFNWSVDAHNMVNKHLGKKELTYDEAIVELSKNGIGVKVANTDKSNNNFVVPAIIVGVSILLAVSIRRK